MRKIIGAAFLSLDGVMQAPGGPTEDPTGGFAYGGWLAPLDDEGIGQEIGTVFGRPYDLLLGRRTYDIFAAYWPYAGDDSAFIRDPFNACTKYVVTHGADLPWEPVVALSGMDAIRALKHSEGPDLVIQGSSTLYPQLLEAGLLDELTLMMTPLVLGGGKRLFGESTPALELEPVRQRLTDKGTLIATYRPAGPLKTAPITPPSTSDREKARQDAMAGGTW
jgi:dihydrofolate reductase